MRRRSGRLAMWLAAALTAGCAGFADTIPTGGYGSIAAEEAAWRQVQPRLAGMSRAGVEQCAGRPLSETRGGPGQATLVYRAEDHRNYCQVELAVRDGTVASVAADHAAPEYMWLRDGSNYCGRIFIGCAR
jgi:uncharacterized protein YqfB (UPF0267 family)